MLEGSGREEGLEEGGRSLSSSPFGGAARARVWTCARVSPINGALFRALTPEALETFSIQSAFRVRRPRTLPVNIIDAYINVRLYFDIARYYCCDFWTVPSPRYLASSLLRYTLMSRIRYICTNDVELGYIHESKQSYSHSESH
jgi:hypothetical protein